MKSLSVGLVFAISLFGVTPLDAKAVVKHQLTEADHNAIDAMADKMFTQLKAGKVDDAVEQFLGTTGLMEGKKAELTQVASQVSAILDIYGPISNCVLVQTDGRGSVVEQQQYICQHEKLATRWKLLFVKTTSSWIAGNLYFDDKLMRDE